ncbi:MAG: alpha-glucan family phosphorylase [Candidatus Nanoarchaeia archaeon]
MQRFFTKNKIKREIAYFSMEIGLNNDMQSYSGGLGILAGDTLKSAADLNVPIIGITLLSEKGYFSQKINSSGEQTEAEAVWEKKKFLKKLPGEVTIKIQGRKVKVSAWQYIIKGIKGYEVPVIFLDTNIPSNSEYDRTLTSYLYGGDEGYRLAQEIVLGIGGAKILDKIGHKMIKCYHMNEGHAALLAIELYNDFIDYPDPIEEVRSRCIFTTHTPVPAGQDRFSLDLVKSLLPDFPLEVPGILDKEGKLNMTLLALFFSKYVNGVAKKHGEVSHEMFPSYHIDSITNGVHSLTWVSEPFKALFDKHISGWRIDPFSLRYVVGIPRKEIELAHSVSKQKMIEYVNKITGADLKKDIFTIGFARRATQYKRPDLLFYELDKLKSITKNKKMQIIYAGKAHPRDYAGKEIIKRIIELKFKLGENLSLVYLENYDMELSKILVSGCDLWLNTPQRPKEASGTSGMKAAHNGVPSLSILDGWWIEGCIEGVTGWAIGREEAIENSDKEDAESMYKKLELIMNIYYNNKEEWMKIMKDTIAINASFYNTHRMLSQYVLNAYLK